MLRKGLEKEFISLLKSLKPDDWNKMVNKERTVKDVVAHMIGWGKEDVKIIGEIWKTKKIPWFYQTEDYEDFNKKHIEYYKDYSPEQLIEEFEKYQDKVQEEIDKIGAEELKKHHQLFSWLFREDDGCHYAVHLKEIKDILSR